MNDMTYKYNGSGVNAVTFYRTLDVDFQNYTVNSLVNFGLHPLCLVL